MAMTPVVNDAGARPVRVTVPRKKGMVSGVYTGDSPECHGIAGAIGLDNPR